MPNLSDYLPVISLGLIAIIIFLFYLHEYQFRERVARKREEELEQLLESLKQPRPITLSSESEEQFKAKLSELIKQSAFSINTAQTQLFQFMQDLQKRSGEFEQAGRESIEQRINQMFGRLEERLSEFLISTEQKTTQSIELEVKAARNLIEGYKQQQLKLIDENIIAMMEQTLSLVLSKKLSLKEQLDLVYEALEKAKVNKFVV